MPTLYVVEPGARIEKEYHRILVTKDDEVLLRVPIRRVTQVALVGRAGVTTPAMHALLQNDVSFLLIGRTGKLLGRLMPPTGANLPLRQIQYRRNEDDGFSIGLARAIVAGKIRNQRVLAQRLIRRHHLEYEKRVLAVLQDSISRARKADSLEYLLGIEGQAAKRYFSVYRKIFDPQWTFVRRTRRPPKDPVNALLSLGYTFLTHAAMSALEGVGLDPYLGYFHAEKYARPALALDLAEEFRAPVVDSLILSLISHRILREAHFEPSSSEGTGIYLTRPGMRIFVTQFSKKLESTVKIRELDRTLTYRKIFEVQARKMARLIQGKTALYRPFQAR